jgi:hypothetical protein
MHMNSVCVSAVIVYQHAVDGRPHVGRHFMLLRKCLQLVGGGHNHLTCRLMREANSSCCRQPANTQSWREWGAKGAAPYMLG